MRLILKKLSAPVIEQLKAIVTQTLLQLILSLVVAPYYCFAVVIVFSSIESCPLMEVDRVRA